MLNNRKHPKLYAGIADKGVEFFINRNDIWCFHAGKIYKGYENIPEHIIEMVRQDMLKHPEALKSLAEWENLSEDDYVRQYIYCRFGGMDEEPDIDKEGKINYTEYFDCGLRGKCKYEGRLCCTIKVDQGHLTKTELKVLKRITLLDKEIASELYVSIDTISSHLQSIRAKTGLANKVELAVFAHKKGLIE